MPRLTTIATVSGAPGELVAYDFRGADELICDFFAAVEQACRQEGTPFEFEAEAVELEMEDDDDTDLPD